MTDPHTQEQTQTHNQQQEPAGLTVAVPKTTATSVIYGTGPGLVATDGFHPALTDDGHQVLVWLTPTPQERQLIAAARWGEPLPGAQTNHTTPPPVLPHDETEPVQVVYHTGRSGSEASQHPAEFARQLSRQYEALSYLTVDEYLKGRNLYNTQKRAPTPPSLEQQRDALTQKIVDRLVREYRFDPNEAEKKATEAVQALAALHEPDQSLQGTHQLAAGEIVWGNGPVNSSIGGQHKPGVSLLDEKARKAQQAGKGHHYLNIRVVLCDSPNLASHIKYDRTTINFDPTESRKHTPQYIRADPATLAQPTNTTTQKRQEKELAARYPGFAQLPPAVQQCLREKNSTTHQPTTPHQHTPTHKPTNQKKPTR